MYKIPPESLEPDHTKYRYDAREIKSSEHNTLEVVALVLGVIAILTVWNLFIGIIIGAGAIVLGILGKHKASQLQARSRLAIIGLTLGVMAIIITVLLYFLIFAVFEQANQGAQEAAKKADANSVMYAVELYQKDHSGQAPESVGDLVAANLLSQKPAAVIYYRDSFESSKYRICAELADGYFRCEEGSCAESSECQAF